LFNSVQKFTCDTLENGFTISINQALESIHPVNKDRFNHFDGETCQNFIHYFLQFISVQAGLSANRKRKVEWCNIRAMQWLRRAFESGNIQFLLDCPCWVNQQSRIGVFLEFGCIF
jgi:hypothetical protein